MRVIDEVAYVFGAVFRGLGSTTPTSACRYWLIPQEWTTPVGDNDLLADLGRWDRASHALGAGRSCTATTLSIVATWSGSCRRYDCGRMILTMPVNSLGRPLLASSWVSLAPMR
jgi:hypothetical protein